jgi:hypothetical protein
VLRGGNSVNYRGMKEFSLNIVDNSISIKNNDGIGRKFLAGLISIAIMLGLVGFIKNVMVCAIIFFACLYTFFKLFRMIQKDWVKRKDTTGTLNFNEVEISASIFQTNTKLNNISHIKITGDYYQGYISGKGDVTHNGLYEMEILENNGQQVRLKFIVFNKQEFQDLTAFFELLYSNFKIDIEEKIGSKQGVGFLLRNDRSFKDIQELKQKFN